MIAITSVPALVLAVVFGAAFGWLLHRGGVTSFDRIVDQLRLRDFTVIKVMLTAIVVGGVGVYVLAQLGGAQLHIREANMLATMLGAAIFGVGMAIYGYCPGTGLAAIGTGSVHAAVGVLGMLAGAIAYAFSFPWLRDNIISVERLGPLTIPGVLGIAPALVLLALAVASIAFFAWIESGAADLR